MPDTPAPAPAKTKKLGVRARSKLEREDRIRLAARHLFAEQGYDATTLRQIARAADLALGTLFNYISDKRDLIYLIFNEELDSVTDKALSAPRPWQSFRAKILSITEPHFRLFGADPTLARILLSEILLQSPGLHLARYRDIRNRLIEGIQELVSAAQQSGELRSSESAELIARHIFFSLSGVLRWWLASCKRPKWAAGQRDFERILILQINGLAESQSVSAPAPAPRRGHRSK